MSISIIVSGGLVQEVYATLPFEIEVEVLDMDCAERESEEAAAKMNEYIQLLQKNHHQIY